MKEEEIDCLKMKDETLASSFHVMQEEFGSLQMKNKVQNLRLNVTVESILSF